MSLSGPRSGITFSGLSSGIDVNSIVTQLVNLEKQPVSRLQSQKAALANQQNVYANLRSRVVGLNTALSTLQQSTTYTPIKASSSDSDAATISATSGATQGVYSLEVSQLAQAHKVSTSSQTDTTSALGYSGVFKVNGKELTIEATDTLTNVAQKINGLGAKVTASLVNGGSGQAFLTLTSNESGASNAIAVENVSGTAINSLGLNPNVTSFAYKPNSTTVGSQSFNSRTSTLASMTGQTGAKTFEVNGHSFSIDYDTDNLDSVMAKVNAYFNSTTSGDARYTGNAQASIQATETNGTTTYRLMMNGSSIPSGISDTGGALDKMGYYKVGFGKELVAAQDAVYKLDGTTFTNKTNSVTDLVPGTTIALKKVTSSAVSLSLTKDTESIKNAVGSFKDAYNSVVGFIRDNSRFDGESFQSGPLFGNSLASSIESSLGSSVFSSISGTISNLTEIGFSLDDGGLLEFDTSKFDTKMSSDPDGIKNLLMSSGKPTSTDVTFVTSSNKTASSSGAGYTIEITQAATKGTLTGGTAQTTANAGGEILSFSGSLFGSTPITFNVTAGASASDLVNSLNTDSRTKDLVTASLDVSGKLKLESKRFGAAGNFSVSSNLAAGVDNSGIGTTGSTVVSGLDVAGTINGEAATGSGQFLLGNTGNTFTEGLQIRYTGSTAGTKGTIAFTSGLSSVMSNLVQTFTESQNGQITAADKALVDQISDIDGRIADLNSMLVSKEAFLRSKFAKMEEAIQRSQSQGSQISAMIAGLSA